MLTKSQNAKDTFNKWRIPWKKTCYEEETFETDATLGYLMHVRL